MSERVVSVSDIASFAPMLDAKTSNQFKSQIITQGFANKAEFVKDWAIVDEEGNKIGEESIQNASMQDLQALQAKIKNQGKGVRLNAFYTIDQAMKSVYKNELSFYADAVAAVNVRMDWTKQAFVMENAGEFGSAKRQVAPNSYEGHEALRVNQNSTVVPFTYQPFTLDINAASDSMMVSMAVESAMYSVYKSCADLFLNGDPKLVTTINGVSTQVYGLLNHPDRQTNTASLGANPYATILAQITLLKNAVNSGLMGNSLYIYYSSNLSGTFDNDYKTDSEKSLIQKLQEHQLVAPSGVKEDSGLPDDTIVFIEMNRRTVVVPSAFGKQTLPLVNSGVGANQYLPSQWVSIVKDAPLFRPDNNGNLALLVFTVSP